MASIPFHGIVNIKHKFIKFSNHCCIVLEQAELFLDRDLKKRENNGANKKIEKINKSNIFSSIEITDIIQGNLNDCSFFAALASILNLPNGSQYIYQAIPYYNEVMRILS